MKISEELNKCIPPIVTIITLDGIAHIGTVVSIYNDDDGEEWIQLINPEDNSTVDIPLDYEDYITLISIDGEMIFKK